MLTYTWEKLSWMHDVEGTLVGMMLVLFKRVALGLWPSNSETWIDEVRKFIQSRYKRQDGASVRRFFTWVTETGDPARRDFLVHEVLNPSFEEVGGVFQPRYLVNVMYVLADGTIRRRQLEFLARDVDDAIDRVISAYVEQSDDRPWRVQKLSAVIDDDILVLHNTYNVGTLDITDKFNKTAGGLVA